MQSQSDGPQKWCYFPPALGHVCVVSCTPSHVAYASSATAGMHHTCTKGMKPHWNITRPPSYELTLSVLTVLLVQTNTGGTGVWLYSADDASTTLTTLSAHWALYLPLLISLLLIACYTLMALGISNTVISLLYRVGSFPCNREKYLCVFLLEILGLPPEGNKRQNSIKCSLVRVMYGVSGRLYKFKLPFLIGVGHPLSRFQIFSSNQLCFKI